MKIKITAVKRIWHKDLSEEYENPIENACSINEGDVFISNGYDKPDGLCESAWESMAQFVRFLADGGEDIYDGWMKNKKAR